MHHLPPRRGLCSNQNRPHERLYEALQRASSASFEKPISTGCVRTFTRVEELRARHGGPLLLDSGCGDGSGSLRLARACPHALIIGIDKSEHRLRRHELQQNLRLLGNCLLVRADLVDFWRLAAAARWRAAHHYLLYPCPWPKRRHLRRRWHAHPIWPIPALLAERLELRTSWKLYAQEFLLAWEYSKLGKARLERFLPNTEPLSSFERKYVAAGQPLYRCLATSAPRKVASRAVSRAVN